MADAERTERELETTWTPSSSTRTMTSSEIWVLPEIKTSATTPLNLDSVYYEYNWNGTSVINTAKALGTYTCAAGYSYFFHSRVFCSNSTGNVYAYFPGITYTGRVNATGALVINGTQNQLANGTGRKNGTFTCTFGIVNSTAMTIAHTCTGPATAGGAFTWYGKTQVFKCLRPVV
jgi:hypothetical protein